jgi:Kef-type K+ transport system membrane component KefB/Trk K+ transport system NAD-binding subunit
MHIGAFEQLAAILVVSALAALLAVLLRQPILLGLLIAGIALGPGVLGLVRIDESITLLAEVGIALLLFLVGLKLDVRIVARLGPVALVVGLTQIVLTFLLGLGIAAAFGRTGITAVYLGLALTFSSTVVVVKLLTDVRMIDRLHGRLAVGILVIQDIVVVLAMIALTATAGDGALAIGEFVGVLLRGVVFVLASLVLGRFVATPTMHLLGRQAELLVLGAIAWAVSFGALSTILGFSAEVGAFLAGMALASTPYREAISGRLTPLRDFLLLFFFIEIGAGIDPASLRAGLPIALTLSAAALVAKPIIVTGLLSLAGHRQKVSLATGITLAQISEFSLILVALGVAQGSVGSDIAGIVTTTALITIAISSQMIARTERLVDRLSSRLPRLERRVAGRADLEDGPPLRPDVIVVGLGRFGSTVVEELLDRGEHVVGVDFDPRAVAEGRLGIPILYGDADDPSLGEHLPLEGSRWVVSTLRSLEANLTLVRSLRLNGYPGAIAVASEDPADCERLRAAGADVTIQPLHVAAAPLVARLDADDARRAAHDDVARDAAFAEFIVERADESDHSR